jgi:hypothetical protein
MIAIAPKFLEPYCYDLTRHQVPEPPRPKGDDLIRVQETAASGSLFYREGNKLDQTPKIEVLQ